MIIGYPLQALGLLFNIITEENAWFIIFSLIAIIIVGSKEIIHDWILGKGNPEWWDFIASAVPVITILITYLILT